MTDITVRFKNGKINFTKTRKAIEDFKAIYSQFNTRTLIASDWYKQVGQPESLNTKGSVTKINGDRDYIILELQAYEFDLKNNILKTYNKHLSGEFAYTSYYKLN